MKTLKQFVSAVMLSIFVSTAAAQIAGTESTTDNLVYTTVNPAPPGAMPHSWTGFTSVTSTGGNTTSDNGAVTGYNPSTGTFMFGYNQGTIAYTYAINQALANAGTGIQVRGYNWSWDINNNNYDNRQGSVDTLTARITTFGANNTTVLQQDSWTYNTKFDWTTFSGTVNYNTPSLVSEYGNMRIEFSGRDSGFWAGYYGPMVRNINVGLRYGADPCAVDSQSSPTCPGYRTYYTFGDDSSAHVPLPFSFPFYGRTFTNSWMHSNGVVSFLDPMSPIQGAAYNPGSWAYCCSGPDLSQNTVGFGAEFNYTIAPFWTDLYPNANSRFYTTKDSSYIRYHWDNIADISNGANLNTFSLELRPSGFIGANYASINSQQQVTIGTIGDLRLGEKTHQFFGIPGISNAANIANWSLNATQATDCSNPLNNAACPGYAEAFLAQQCSITGLYSPSCPTWTTEVALCEANPFRSSSCPNRASAESICADNVLNRSYCPGYQTALNTCSTTPLSNDMCPGFQLAYNCSVNPLYSTSCEGYDDAYYVQQCTADPLYDKGCTGYDEAYALKYIVNPSPTPTSTTTVAVTTTSDPVAQAAPLIADPVVNQTITTTTTSASPSQPVAPVQLAPAPQPVATVAAKTEEKKEEPKKEETKSESSSTASTTASSSSSETKDQPKTTRQALAERRLAAARAKAVEDGKQLAGKMGEAATIEAQIQAQAVVMTAMGFVPGFDAYGQAKLPDGVGYRPFEIYRGQRNVDNPAGRRFLTGADARHQEMVDQQYAR